MNSIPDRLPSRPLRNWFLAWHIHTGDPAEVIAKGFDLSAELVADLLGLQPPLMLTVDEAMETCQQLRIDPRTRWNGSRLHPRWALIETSGTFQHLVEMFDG